MKTIYLAGVFPVVLGACSPTPATLPNFTSLSAAAMPTAPRHKTHHHNVIQNFESRKPTEPKPWLLINGELADPQGEY